MGSHCFPYRPAHQTLGTPQSFLTVHSLPRLEGIVSNECQLTHINWCNTLQCTLNLSVQPADWQSTNFLLFHISWQELDVFACWWKLWNAICFRLALLASHPLVYLDFSSRFTFFSLRCKELPEGSSGQHHHSSCWGSTNNLHTSLVLWISNPAFTTSFFTISYVFITNFQVFTVSKDLVPRVLSKIVESVADEMCRLMQCVSSFSKNGALQVHALTRLSSSLSLIVRPWLISRPSH